MNSISGAKEDRTASRTGAQYTGAVMLLLGFVFPLQGCTMFGITKVSEPQLAPEDRALFQLMDDVLAYRDITISVKPQNYYVSFLSIGPILPLIPLPSSGRPLRDEQPFRLVVQMETQGDGYTFDPSYVLLHYENATYRPVEARGPYVGGGYAREVQKTIPGHKWECYLPRDGIENGLEPRRLRGKVCFDITFPLATLPPETPFRVTLGGIEKDGEAVSSPELGFRSGSRSGFTLMMSQ